MIAGDHFHSQTRRRGALLRLALFLVTAATLGCGDDHANKLADMTAADMTAGPDLLALNCVPTEPGSGVACTVPGLFCPYSDKGVKHCDCVAPENRWQCCDDLNQHCPNGIGNLMALQGQICCVNTPPLPPGFTGTAVFSCQNALCDSGVAQDYKCACSSDDRHWRCGWESCPLRADGGA